MSEVKFIILGKGFDRYVEKLTRNDKGFWVDSKGTVWALSDDSASVDPITRCGVGVFSLPKDSPLNELCSEHDYLYSSPAYQAYHTRQQADSELERIFKESGRPLVGRLFYRLARWFGSSFWENKDTNN